MSLEDQITNLASTIGADIKDLYTKVDKTLRINQQVPLAVWTLAHNLGKNPSVTVIDSAGEEVYGSVNHDSVNQVTITFNAAFSGSAFFN